MDNQDTKFKDLDGWDSMSHMIFITQMEEQLSIELSTDDIVNMKDLRSVMSIVKGKH
jgi:acyl carrier protein